MGHYLFSRNSCKRKKKEIVACERRTSTRRESCGRIFLANGHYTFHPSMFKTFLPFRSMREFFLPTSIFLSRSNSSTLNFPLLSVRLSTTNLKMFQLGVARIRKFVLRWKKKKKKKPILEITIAQCIPRLMINITRILRKILCATFQREIIQNYVIVFIFFWDNDACRRDIRSWRRK